MKMVLADYIFKKPIIDTGRLKLFHFIEEWALKSIPASGTALE
jgi:hypothetical protein